MCSHLCQTKRTEYSKADPNENKKGGAGRNYFDYPSSGSKGARELGVMFSEDISRVCLWPCAKAKP